MNENLESKVVNLDRNRAWDDCKQLEDKMQSLVKELGDVCDKYIQFNKNRPVPKGYSSFENDMRTFEFLADTLYQIYNLVCYANSKMRY